jgi:hypothetical protein
MAHWPGSPSSADIVAGARLLWQLPSFLRHPLSGDEAHATIRHRLERRAADFLALVRRAIFGQPASPYRQLLGLAGCEYGDFVRLVEAEGLEGALRTLIRHGVYLTVEELKGRRPVLRGGARIDVSPLALRNPSVELHVTRHTGGSRGPSVPASVDLAHVRERAAGCRVYLDARGGHRWRHATWEGPGGNAVVHLLEYSCADSPIARWFSPVPPDAPGLHARYRWVGRVLRLSGWLTGRPLPPPTLATLDDPLPVVRWMVATLHQGDTPHLFTFSSCAVRVCQAARAAGLDLAGARFTVVGEPFTQARSDAIRQVGGDVVPRFGSTESSGIGSGCLRPQAVDEMHLLEDLNAVIQAGAEGASAGLPPRALLVSSLRAAAPVILLNASLGDQADFVDRQCGCPMEAHGWTKHLQAVRSFEKLTAGGVTFLDTDIIRAIEEVLPARFGGGPLDYQLVEDEAPDGRPLVRLLVHPGVGPADSRAIADAFLAAIASGSDAQRLMAMQWRQGGLPVVEREVPHVTGAVKVLHLHRRRRD